MNTDTNGTGTLPAPRSYMVYAGRLVQVRRMERVSFARYWWDMPAQGKRMLAGERADHVTFTYESDRELRAKYNV
jgi:hypothetical protein